MLPRTSDDRPVALVTGGNKGIGLQIAIDLAAHGFTVLLGARSYELGAAAAQGIGPGPCGPTRRHRPGVAPLEDVRAIFETNVFGVINVTQAMLPLLREAPSARIVNVSSSSGSLTLNSDRANPHRPMFRYYSASKTALNAVTLAFAIELEAAGIKVNAACPGFTATALNDFRGTRTVEEGAREAVRLALIGADGPTGTFSNDDGPVPW